MKNVIIGTSGHVDHGKTCLIKALTGTDCDRLKEEKKRGITIENGFADFTYQDYNISIIDVPGHEKFVRNMLMGIGGIDLVLLIVALDEGVMPQTVEHFNILSMLNLSNGIIVYTKKDLVNDSDWISMVKEDTRNLVKGTFMENALEIEVSSYTGENIDLLRELIVKSIDDSKLKNDEIPFRLPIDRVFTIEGFGTVVTGTLISGKVSTGDTVMLYPKKILTKVRNVQVHNEKVDTAYAGNRTALNLQGLKKEEIERGTVLAEANFLIPTKILDVKLNLFKDSIKNIYNESRVHFYTGASESIGKIILLDKDSIKKGESAYCQIRLDEEIVCKKDDNFIIRFLSPLISIGGGKILDDTPKKHKRFDCSTIENLKIKENGSIEEVIEVFAEEKLYDVISLANKLNVSKNYLLKKIKDIPNLKVLDNGIILGKEYMNKVKKVSEDILEKYHKENEMSLGISKEEFREKFSSNLKINDKKTIDLLLNILSNSKVISFDGNFIRLYTFKQNISKELEDRILKKYIDSRFEMPTIDEVLSSEKDKKNGRHVLESLVKDGRLIKLNDIYCISKEAYEEAISIVKEETSKNGSISLATFRDLVKTSRKFAIPILEYFDFKKITRMVNEVRVWNLNN